MKDRLIHLVEDAREKVLQLLGLGVADDDVGVGSDRCLHFRVGEVDDLATLHEEVDLLDGWDRVDSKALQGVLDACHRWWWSCEPPFSSCAQCHCRQCGLRPEDERERDSRSSRDSLLELPM